jgi:hypothetical protein
MVLSLKSVIAHIKGIILSFNIYWVMGFECTPLLTKYFFCYFI